MGGKAGWKILACSEGSSGEMLSAVLKSEKPSSALTDLKSANPSPASKREGREREKEIVGLLKILIIAERKESTIVFFLQALWVKVTTETLERCETLSPDGL